MLESTFQHIKGIGKVRERTLWRNGILTWDQYEEFISNNFPLFSNLDESPAEQIFDLSRDALHSSDVEFFKSKLNRNEHYRIALSFPKDILFLDIETTGLSIYYDDLVMVGWDYRNSFNLFVKGDNEEKLRDDLQKAKVLITFNGTLFDIPFLQKEFEGIILPPIHLDLRFISRRIGLSGGQKEIEKQIGFKRKKKLKDLSGEKAPLLWFKYRLGDLSALKDLVLYNHADVEGMKWIFDHFIKKIIKKEGIPSKIVSTSKTNFAIVSEMDLSGSNNGPGIKIKPANGQFKPSFRFSHFNISKDFSVIGIDLTGSENRPSGYCYLKNNFAITKTLSSDNEIIQECLDSKPDLISIDSPLSLPQGRTTVFDDDPKRDKGIMRYCERLLKKRGVNVYPCLIPSMQKLTKRGMELADKFRKQGIPVIESYPGAAQDIIGIPRKSAGLDFLRKGLADFGLEGEFLNKNVTHDELDAITSALVGLFFWSGYYEAIGNVEEDYLIIPDIKQKPNSWDDGFVIGFSGPIATGKTFASRMLERGGFVYRRFSQIVAREVEMRGLPVNRFTLQEIGGEINKQLGQRWLCKQLIQDVPRNSHLVIDGLRFPEDHAFLVEHFGPRFIHAYIESKKEIRKNRYLAKYRYENNHNDFDKITAQFTESKIFKLKRLSHFVVNNNSDEDSLHFNIQSMMNEHEKRLQCQ